MSSTIRCALLLIALAAVPVASAQTILERTKAPAPAPAPAPAQTRPRTTVPRPADTMRSAETIYVRSKTTFMKATALEQALLNRKEIQAWGLSITRTEADADLIIE